MPETNVPATILAFDFGLRRIGVAVGQTVTGSASPVGVVRNEPRGPDLDRIDALIREWRPACLVVGMPAHADGTPTALAQPLQHFIESLAAHALPVHTIDERHTSVEAEGVLKRARAAGTRGRISRESIDSAAAVVIAERYLAAREIPQ